MGWFSKKDKSSSSSGQKMRRDDVPMATAAVVSGGVSTGQGSSRSSHMSSQQQQQQQQQQHAMQQHSMQQGGQYVVQHQGMSVQDDSSALRTPSYVGANSSLVHSANNTIANNSEHLLERRDSDDEALMVIDRPPSNKTKDAFDVEDASNSFSKDFDNEPEIIEPMRQNHLNSLFNGHLMKWKFEAEEGSIFIRVPAFFGALGLIATAVVALVIEPGAFTAHSIVMAVCVIIMSIFVLVLDGRFLSTNPLSARAHLRNIMTRNFNIFRFVWGRGLLYIAAGILNVAQIWMITVYSGAAMIFIGFIAIAVGVHASRKFAALRNSLADESFLLLVFSNYDSDGDGYLLPNEFALLLADLGMELDDRYTLKAFTVIDTDNDRKISFEEFSHWWASGYIERGRRYRIDDDDVSYRRME